jgi:hypothetical protein
MDKPLLLFLAVETPICRFRTKRTWQLIDGRHSDSTETRTHLAFPWAWRAPGPGAKGGFSIGLGLVGTAAS